MWSRVGAAVDRLDPRIQLHEVARIVGQELNPVYNSNFIAEFRQPFLRNFGIDFNRSQIDIAKNTRSINAEGWRSQVIKSLNDVERAYWTLLATRRNLTIMVDHTFLFTGAVRKIRQLMDEGVLGDIYYYDSTRVNLGLFQHDVSVVWDLAPHDLSIMDFLIHDKPEAVIATGETHLNGLVDVAYITVYFPGNTIAHINVNWLSPVKIRTTLIGGEKRMLVWNDLEADEKLKIYDKGVAMNGNGHGNGKQGLYELLVSYRSGDMWAPRVEQTEALKVELSYFIDCVRTTQTPINDGVAGLRVVQLLEAADRSLKERGRTVTL